MDAPNAPSAPASPDVPARIPGTSDQPKRRPAAPPVISLTNASRGFGDVVAVDGVSLEVPAGTILGVIGPSGSGKTTTIRMLTGALAPTTGTVRVLGEDPQRFSRRTRERLGYMPQQFTLYPDLTARENVDFVASLFGLLWLSRFRRTRQALELVDLWTTRGRRAGAMSGGMQRRLELACALVHQPDLLFLDEPTAGIDPILRATIWTELQRLRDAGRTLLVTTQYVNEAESCDAVALLSDGRLIALAAPDDLRRRAFGGDTVEIETTRLFDGRRLADLAAIRTVVQEGPTRLRLTVDDGATALPGVVEAVAAQGGVVAAASETRPSFDEIFRLLIEQDRAARNAADAADGAAETGASAA